MFDYILSLYLIKGICQLNNFKKLIKLRKLQLLWLTILSLPLAISFLRIIPFQSVSMPFVTWRPTKNTSFTTSELLITQNRSLHLQKLLVPLRVCSSHKMRQLYGTTIPVRSLLWKQQFEHIYTNSTLLCIAKCATNDSRNFLTCQLI